MATASQPARRERQSAVRIAFRVIHRQRLWRHYGKEGAGAVAAAVRSELGAKAKPMSVSYFQWLKSRYLAQRMLGLPLDRLVKMTNLDRRKMREIRARARSNF